MDYTRLTPAFIYISVNPLIPNLNRHNRVFDICLCTSTREQCQCSQKKLHPTRCWLQLTQREALHLSPRETHGRHYFASYFTPPLAFSVHYITISMHSLGNVNRLDSVLNGNFSDQISRCHDAQIGWVPHWPSSPPTQVSTTSHCMCLEFEVAFRKLNISYKKWWDSGFTRCSGFGHWQ